MDRRLIVGEVMALRASGLGDLVTAAPALRHLRRHARGRETVLLTSPWLRDLAEGWELADLVDDQVGLAPVRRRGRVALAVNLHGSGPESHRALLATHPAELWAHRHDDVPASSDGPEWDPELREADRWLGLLSHYGVDVKAGLPPLPRPRTPIPAGAGAPGCCVVHPGAAAPARRWPPTRWAAVAAALVAHGHRVVVTGTAAEEPTARAVCDRAGLDPACNLAGRFGLWDLAGLVGVADLVVSTDTGIAHLAGALGTSSVTLYGPSAPVRWGPPPGPHRVIWRGSTGDPHGSVLDPGLATITADEVVAEALDLVAHRPADSG